MHEIIALDELIAARAAERGAAERRQAAVRPFSLERIRTERFSPSDKHPKKTRELRPTRPIARREAARLGPAAERTGSIVDKLAHRVRRAGKLRLFRMWKLVGKHRGPAEAGEEEISPIVTSAIVPPVVTADGPLRPLAERLAWLRRTRRL